MMDFQVEDVSLSDGRHFKVIRDDLLEGGTKIRGLLPFIQLIINQNKGKKGIKELVYASPAYGYAQVAISVAARLMGLRSTIFVAKRGVKHPNTLEAESLGSKIVEVPYGYLVVVKKHASDYVNEDSSRYLLPWGLSDPSFKSILTKEIKKEMSKPAVKRNLRPNNSGRNTVWVAVGSGTLFEVLTQVFPNNVKFNLVQVGAEYKVDDIPNSLKDRISAVYVAPEKFEQKAKIMPPYPSNPWYDAKVWRFVEEYGKSGDIIWNVA